MSKSNIHIKRKRAITIKSILNFITFKQSIENPTGYLATKNK